MNTRFEKVPLTKSEMDISFSTYFKGIRLQPRKGILFVFLIPAFALVVVLIKYVDTVSILAEFFKVVSFLFCITVVQYLLRAIEVRLKFKKVGKVQVLAKINFFFFKLLVLRNFFPLILELQNQEFDRLNKGDLVILEKTGLNRFISWRLI